MVEVMRGIGVFGMRVLEISMTPVVYIPFVDFHNEVFVGNWC